MTTTHRRRLTCLTLLVLVTCAACSDGKPSMAERAAAQQQAADAASEKARAENRAKAEAQRLAALWLYQEATVGGGPQITAAIRSRDEVESGGDGAHRVQLVFRDHAEWGRSSYLVLQAGDFACRSKCTVNVVVDDAPAQRLAAFRPRTDEAIAMFVNDSATLWRLTDSASQLSIEFPVAAGGTRTAHFEVSGLDAAKMRGW